MIEIVKDSVDVTVEVVAVDAVTGAPKTGLSHPDVEACYVRTRSAAATMALAPLAGPQAEHADGGFVEIDAAACPGWYRLDVPDDAFAAEDGVKSVLLSLRAEGALFSPIRVRLVADVASEVHLCKAALVNQRVHTVSTGVDEIKDDDGETTLVTMTPQDGGEDSIVIVPS